MPEVTHTLSLILDFIGTVIIGIALLRVHTKMKKTHKIGKLVIKSINRERRIVMFGIALIAIGFVLNFV